MKARPLENLSIACDDLTIWSAYHGIGDGAGFEPGRPPNKIASPIPRDGDDLFLGRWIDLEPHRDRQRRRGTRLGILNPT